MKNFAGKQTNQRTSQHDEVAAVIVTYNRRALLEQCLGAILQQTRPIDELVIWNNASSDDTELFLKEYPWPQGIEIQVHHSSKNIGGAGGFKEGLKRAYQQGHDWIWVMDDDTIPRPDCLHELLRGKDKCADLGSAKILASKVLWKDGTLHPMNLVGTKFGYDRQRFMTPASVAVSAYARPVLSHAPFIAVPSRSTDTHSPIILSGRTTSSIQAVSYAASTDCAYHHRWQTTSQQIPTAPSTRSPSDFSIMSETTPGYYVGAQPILNRKRQKLLPCMWSIYYGMSVNSDSLHPPSQLCLEALPRA